MRYLLVLGALLFLSGCGGGGSSVPVITFPSVNTDRVGAWRGRATDSVTGAAGVLSLTIDAAGVVRGTWRTDGGVSWDVSGTFESIPPSFQNNITLMLVAAGQQSLSERGTLLVGLNGDLGGVFEAMKIGSQNRPVLSSHLTVNLQRQ